MKPVAPLQGELAEENDRQPDQLWADLIDLVPEIAYVAQFAVLSL